MCFHQANQFVPVKEDVFTSGLKWLMQNQRSDGSIHEPGRVFAYAMQVNILTWIHDCCMIDTLKLALFYLSYPQKYCMTLCGLRQSIF